MMNTRISTIVLILAIAQLIMAQGQDYDVEYRTCDNCRTNAANDMENTDYTYGELDAFDTNEVTSDFGPRQLGNDEMHGTFARTNKFVNSI